MSSGDNPQPKQLAEAPKGDETAARPKDPVQQTQESFISDAWGAASHFTGAFVRAAAAPLTGLGQFLPSMGVPTSQPEAPVPGTLGASTGDAPTGTGPPTSDHNTADTFGTMAGTAFDYILLSRTIGGFLPKAAAIRTTTLTSGLLGFASPTENGTLSEHFTEGLIGASTGLMMGGAGAAWTPSSLAGRLAQTTLVGGIGGLTNTGLEGLLNGKPLTASQFGESGATWAATGLAMTVLHSGGSALAGLRTPGAIKAGSVGTGGEPRPMTISTTDGQTDLSVRTGEPTRAGTSVPASETVRLDKADPIGEPVRLAAFEQAEKAKPSEPRETLPEERIALPQVSEARIREIAQAQGFYRDIQEGRTNRQCFILSEKLQEALAKEGIPTLRVGRPEQTRFDMPHYYLIANTENGIRIVDPTLNQFAPEFKDVFIGTREEAMKLAKDSKLPIDNLWVEMSEGRQNFNNIWHEQPLVQPVRYEKPGEAELADFEKTWGGSGVKLYDPTLVEHATSWAAEAPNWDLSLQNRIEFKTGRRWVPNSFIEKVGDELGGRDVGTDLANDPIAHQKALEERMRQTSEDLSDKYFAAKRELRMLSGLGSEIEDPRSFNFPVPDEQLTADYAAMRGQRQIDKYLPGGSQYGLKSNSANELFPYSRLKDISALLKARYGQRTNLSVLEIGAGETTDVARTLAPNAASYISVDAQPSALSAQRQFLADSPIPQVGHIQGDVAQLGVASKSQDLVVVSNNDIFKSGTITEMEMAVRELARVLKPGGELVLQRWNSVFWLKPSTSAAEYERQNILLSQFRMNSARVDSTNGNRWLVSLTKRY